MQLKCYIFAVLWLHGLTVLAQAPQPAAEEKTEIDFLFSYYEQDGNHSAVTGGQGTEELHHYSGIVIVNVPLKENKRLRVENGISYFTSASHDNINPATISSASYADFNLYLDLTYTVSDSSKRSAFGFRGRGLLEEYFGSLAVGANYLKTSRDRNREIKFDLNFFMDKWALYYKIRKLYPVEIRNTGIDYAKTDKRYSTNFSVALSQVINPRLQASFSTGFIHQFGLLNTPYHRVYFEGEDLPRVEQLPDQRWRFPLSMRLHYYLGDRWIFRTFYRYYWDTFGIQAHTVNLEVPFKMTNFIVFQPFYRYHQQQGSKYFAPYKMHNPEAEYYTSDYDMSTFDSHYFGAGFKISPAFGIGKFKLEKTDQKSFIFREVQLRGGAYRRSDGMYSWLVSCGLSFLH